MRALRNGSLVNNKEQSIYAGLYSFEHTGLLPGYQSLDRYYADIDAVVIQFTNTSGGKAWSFSEIMHKRLVRILRNHNTLHVP
ncbi:hypothetical protein [Roseivirga sp. UBA838]|uniref:hypothetical protein n=1 Tax=Roseivirga sp. UBA838 TaxID=1947393 RepID=UPI00257FBCBF|nr:hypothetical protein [Roseivirga sp. UBA838]